MLVKYFDGEVKEEFFNYSKEAESLLKTALGTVKIVENHFNHFEIQEAAQEIISLVDAANKFVTDNQATVQFEAPLSGYNFVPSYPADLESNAYKFAGWYTSPGCYDGSEVNWDTATMPPNDLMLYAKWVPVTHTVKT